MPISFANDSAKGATKVFVEYGVDDGIEGRVHVTEPKGQGKRHLGYLEIWEYGLNDVEKEERQPAGDEATHDEAQNEGGALLLFSRNAPALALGITGLGGRGGLLLRLDGILADATRLLGLRLGARLVTPF